VPGDGSDRLDQAAFRSSVEAALDAKELDFDKTLNILVIGKVSAGKSSLINALLRRSRSSALAEVGARSGVTTKVKILVLDDHVCIIDSPGLDDIQEPHSAVTRAFLTSVDVGLLVLTGSADASQAAHLKRLQASCEHAFVVLNKMDEWDRLDPSASAEVIEQWKLALGVDKVYPTCTFGFDPHSRADAPMDIRGVDELRADLEDFLRGQGKALLLARQMGEKREYALKLIVATLVTVGGEAFLPGCAVIITATQAAAIAALYYLYTGRVLSRLSVLAMLPTFAARAAGSNLALWAKSLLPPTGIADAAAAGVAVTITAAMLLTVNSLLSAGAEIREASKLSERFQEFRVQIKASIAEAPRGELVRERFWRKLLHDLTYA
jgi:small GTP-binding protein